MSSARLELVAVRPGVCYGVWGAVLLLGYRDAPSADDLRRREPLLDRLVAAHGSCAFISIIDANSAAALPDADSRAESKRQIERHAPNIRAGAIVVRGAGLKLTLLRSFMRGLFLLKSAPFPHRFFAELRPAAQFCLDKLGHDSERDLLELVGAAEQVERASRQS